MDAAMQQPGMDFGVPMQRFSFRVHETQKYKSISTNRTHTSLATNIVMFPNQRILATEYTTMREGILYLVQIYLL
jgi:hypothetical protein